MTKRIFRVYLKPDAPRTEVTRLFRDSLTVQKGVGYDRAKKMSYIDLEFENGSESFLSEYKSAICETSAIR
ncbi:MAG: hypothetical protein HY512_03770 [Candidatus Aenigmarchaeota archaeon]|nr:hypothetical protein [Candidatus Aenigmarchaeota archaeon]